MRQSLFLFVVSSVDFTQIRRAGANQRTHDLFGRRITSRPASGAALHRVLTGPRIPAGGPQTQLSKRRAAEERATY
jgi:hypothetical protein